MTRPRFLALTVAIAIGFDVQGAGFKVRSVQGAADAVLGKRPVWVREGAAIYFAGEPMIPGEPRQRPAFKPEPRGSSPDDNELLHPVSVGALSNAYARARACFAKQIQAGKNWKDVR